MSVPGDFAAVMLREHATAPGSHSMSRRSATHEGTLNIFDFCGLGLALLSVYVAFFQQKVKAF
jgi:hypothetical protein